MLSVAKIKKSSLGYYCDLAREDYYLSGGEPPGHWFGRGAAALGLTKTVLLEDLHCIIQGYAPDGTSKLVQNAGTKDRHPGSDLTFSAPKSVSILWSQSDRARRKEIERLVLAAARDALQYLEDNAVFTRRGRGGATTEQGAGIVGALFPHETSRSQDPQLHVHCVIANLVLRNDRSWGSMLGITSRKRSEDRIRTRLPFYREKMSAGALFRASLAASLERGLGVGIRRSGNGFEIEGIPAGLIRAFSTRRQEIESELTRVNDHSAKSAEAAALRTRKRKRLVPREELFRRWHEQAKAFDLSAVYCQKPKHEAARGEKAAIEAATKRLEAERTPLTVTRAVRRFAEEAQGRGLDAAAVLAALQRAFTVPPLAPLAKRADREARAADRIVRRSAQKRSQVVGTPNLYLAEKQVGFLRGRRFTDEERRALDQITKARGAVQVLANDRRIDASDVLTAARLAWERAGYRVLLVGATRAAADGWAEKTGIHSITLGGLLRGLTTNRGLLRGYDAALRKSFQIGPLGFTSTQAFLRYAVKASGKWITLDEKTVLVLDEPRALSLQVLSDLLRRIDGAGAKLVLLDDTPQAHRREDHADAVSRLLGAKQIRAELEEVLRQQEEQRDREP